MQLVRYNPFQQTVSFRSAVDRLIEESVASSRNAFRGVNSNLYETAEGFLLQMPMAGVKAEDVEITVQQELVTVKWERKAQAPENATTHWSGIQTGRYQQSFRVPTSINSEGVEASFRDGVLHLNLPKAEHAKPRTIKIQPE